MVLGTVLTITAVGCKTSPEGVTPIPGQRVTTSDTALTSGTPVPDTNPINPINPIPPTTGGGIPPNPSGSHPGWTENRDQLHNDNVYFDFDKSAIKSSETSKLDEVSAYLKNNPENAIRVEGNCDERGTEEYNRSLGERRSFAAREYLVRLGIDAGRIDTLSNGKDKPAEMGHNEEAWAKNRRDEFVLLTAPKP
jgi:peptidoglycan-associated lipoprotein